MNDSVSNEAQGLANEAVDAVQALANHAVDAGEDAAQEALKALLAVNRAIGDALQAIGDKLVG